jgi:signal transduction histidine kinase
MWVIILLSLINMALLAYIFRYKKELSYISRQMKTSKGNFYNIRMGMLNHEMEDLVSGINELYALNQRIKVKNKKSEEELWQSVTGLTHDLRTPLTSIMGYIELLKDENISEADQEKYFTVVEKRTKALQGLIFDIYELCKIEGNLTLNYKLVNLKDILLETIILFYNDIEKRGIRPVIDIDESVPSIIVDEEAVQRIFLNLIDNLLKHAEKDAVISLKVGKEHILTQFKNRVEHMREEDMERIFDRFYTAKADRSDKNTGLGLSIVKILVDKMGHKAEAALQGNLFVVSIEWAIKPPQEYGSLS